MSLLSQYIAIKLQAVGRAVRAKNNLLNVFSGKQVEFMALIIVFLPTTASVTVFNSWALFTLVGHSFHKPLCTDLVITVTRPPYYALRSFYRLFQVLKLSVNFLPVSISD